MNAGRALRADGFEIWWHDESFDQDTPDHVWIPVVANNGFLILTGDERISKEPLSTAVALEVRAAMLMIGGNWRTAALVHAIRSGQERMHGFAAAREEAFLGKLRRDGLPEDWLDADALRRKLAASR